MTDDTWMGMTLAGRDPGEIDDWVDRWHDDETATAPLHDFLGLTWDEYSVFMTHPDGLHGIVEARRAASAPGGAA